MTDAKDVKNVKNVKNMKDIKNKDERKTPEEIKQKILEVLDDKPLNALEISKAIGSNWSTVKNYIADLIAERKVKEFAFNGQVIYQKITEDTYFNIPITKEERALFCFLFNHARELFKRNEREATKTDINKAVVQVIDKFNLQVPTVWYLYGKMALLKYEPEKEYVVTIIPQNEKEILKQLYEVVKEISKKKNSHQVREQQYQFYNKEFYQLKEDIYQILLHGNLNEEEKKEKLKELLSHFIISLPYNENYASVSELLYNFNLLFKKMSFFKNLEEYRKQILDSFDSIWKIIAVRSFFESLSNYSRFKGKQELWSFYFENALNMKLLLAQDSLTELEDIYFSKLKELKEPPRMPETPESKIFADALMQMAKGGSEDE
jgi:hypothetical protein